MAHRNRESPVFHRRLDRPYPPAERAEKCAIHDEAGHRGLDDAGGARVADLGHGPGGTADVAAAMAGLLRAAQEELE